MRMATAFPAQSMCGLLRFIWTCQVHARVCVVLSDSSLVSAGPVKSMHACVCGLERCIGQCGTCQVHARVCVCVVLIDASLVSAGLVKSMLVCMVFYAILLWDTKFGVKLAALFSVWYGKQNIFIMKEICSVLVQMYMKQLVTGYNTFSRSRIRSMCAINGRAMPGSVGSSAIVLTYRVPLAPGRPQCSVPTCACSCDLNRHARLATFQGRVTSVLYLSAINIKRTIIFFVMCCNACQSPLFVFDETCPVPILS